MPTDNQNQPKKRQDLASPEVTDLPKASVSDDCCRSILDRLNKGLPVVLTEPGFDVTGQPGAVEFKFLGDFIRSVTINFLEYKDIMDGILNSIPDDFSVGVRSEESAEAQSVSAFPNRQVPLDDLEKRVTGSTLFSTTYAYQLLKYATEKYLRLFYRLPQLPNNDFPFPTLPYLRLIESKLEACSNSFNREGVRHYRPFFLELIWSYWHEEGMLVHTVNAIARRFQNIRAGSRDPLGNLELDPLRPLNNILWGYIQDGVHRLTPLRRAYEYDHHYGISLLNASGIAPADSRSYFIQSFHNLLNKCSVFYREADNLMKVPDALPVLNALREVHLQLAEGAHNQFGDLPLTSRAEMLMEQYILARPEMREFLGGRIMAPYDETWMDRVETMKALQGWNRASITYFHDLAKYGEQIILSIRWISWTQIDNRNIARAWALEFRDAIQRYIHCYQAVAGVDLSAINVAGSMNERSLMPAVLIRRKVQRDMMMRRR